MRRQGLLAPVWVWPASLMLLIGGYRLTEPLLWRDELSSWSFASRPVPELADIVRHSDASQLGYYLLLHYWIAVFGDSVAAMRLLSLLAMTGAAACVGLAGRRLAGDRAGLLAGLLFALVPSVSRFAQEVRFYALAVLLAMLATLMLIRALDRPSSVARWAGYASFVMLLGYADLVALTVVAGHAVIAALRWETDRDWRLYAFAPAALAGCLACLPLALVGMGQAGRQLNWLPRPGLSLTAFSFFGRNLFYSTGAAAALLIVAALAWAAAWRAAAAATAIAVTPVAAAWLVSQGATSYFFPRYLLFTVGAWAILGGIALRGLSPRMALAVVLAFGVIGTGDQRVIRGVGAHDWAQYPENTGTGYWDYAAAAAIIAERARPGDAIAYPGRMIRWEMLNDGVGYYLAQDLPADRIPRQVFVIRSAASAGTLYPVLTSDPVARLAGIRRVWVVADYGNRLSWPLPPAEAVALRADFPRQARYGARGLTIYLLTRRIA